MEEQARLLAENAIRFQFVSMSIKVVKDIKMALQDGRNG
jgi:hypothetical protein